MDTPASIRWADEARKARRRLYPVTVVYTLVTGLALAWALLARPVTAAAAWLLGVAFWTWLEYTVHRYVLHGVFPDGPGMKHVLHRLFDHLHVEHHQRPWDGDHISGALKDTGPFALLFVLVALAFPPHTLLAFVAGLLQAYVVEEWVHLSVHFCHFDNLYFRYIKRHHLYHHSLRGQEIAYGLTSGLWDVAYDTRISASVRAALYGPLLGRPSPRRQAS